MLHRLGLVGEADDAEHRAEDLLARDRHAGLTPSNTVGST
jgi:hypothetical protein